MIVLYSLESYCIIFFFYEVKIPVTEEELMFRLTKYDGEMFCAAIDGYRRHKNNDVALVEQNQTFKSKGDRIVRIEDESMRKKPFQWVFDCLSHYAKCSPLLM